MKKILTVILLGSSLAGCVSNQIAETELRTAHQSLSAAELARLENARSTCLLIYPRVPGPSQGAALLGMTVENPRFSDCVASKMNVAMPARPTEVYVETTTTR